jgi:hypothetical protein
LGNEKKQKKTHFKKKIHFLFFIFVPTFSFFYLFLIWVCRICDPMVGGKKYYLHQVGEGNSKRVVVVIQ